MLEHSCTVSVSEGVQMSNITLLNPSLPPALAALLEQLPPRVPREQAGQLISRHFFAVSHRTMERWPISWRRLNGKAHCETAELFAEAQRVLDEAPAIRSGKAQQAA
jgi:hypothetical protein